MTEEQTLCIMAAVVLPLCVRDDSDDPMGEAAIVALTLRHKVIGLHKKMKNGAEK